MNNEMSSDLSTIMNIRDLSFMAGMETVRMVPLFKPFEITADVETRIKKMVGHFSFGKPYCQIPVMDASQEIMLSVESERSIVKFGIEKGSVLVLKQAQEYSNGLIAFGISAYKKGGKRGFYRLFLSEFIRNDTKIVSLQNMVEEILIEHDKQFMETESFIWDCKVEDIQREVVILGKVMEIRRKL